MKTFTSKELARNPGPVYREVDKNGSVIINHQRYEDIVFVLSSKVRGAAVEEDEE